MDTIESLQALDAMVREAVVDLLYRLADDELIMGHRDSQWTWPASVPAEDLPFASMARDEIGHAHAYYQMLHEFGEPDPNTLMLRRQARQFRPELVAIADEQHPMAGEMPEPGDDRAVVAE